MNRQDLRNIIEEAYYEFLLEVDSEYSPMAYAKRVLNGKMDFFKAREESEIPYSSFISLLKKLDPHYKAPSLAEYNMYERGEIRPKKISVTNHDLHILGKSYLEKIYAL